MGRTPNQEHVRRALEAIARLHSETGWHEIDELAADLGTTTDRLASDLRRVHYAAGYQTVPIMFGDDIDPPHPDGPAVVRYVDDLAIGLPLPLSRVDLTRIALTAQAAAAVDPFAPASDVLRSLHDRLLATLDVTDTLRRTDVVMMPTTVRAAHDAIDAGVALEFDYRSLDDDAAATRRVAPARVWRAGSGWLLLGHDLDAAADRTYRFDRIVGGITSHGRAGSPLPHPVQPFEAHRTRVRVRIEESSQWALEDYAPGDVTHRPDGHVEVTIELYPPVDARLARLLFLLGPSAVVVSPNDVLGAYDQQLRALAELYGVSSGK